MDGISNSTRPTPFWAVCFLVTTFPLVSIRLDSVPPSKVERRISLPSTGITTTTCTHALLLFLKRKRHRIYRASSCVDNRRPVGEASLISKRRCIRWPVYISIETFDANQKNRLHVLVELLLIDIEIRKRLMRPMPRKGLNDSRQFPSVNETNISIV